MKFKVTVQKLDDEREAGTPNVYEQTVEAESFDLNALIQAVNRRKRGPRVRAKKGTEA